MASSATQDPFNGEKKAHNSIDIEQQNVGTLKVETPKTLGAGVSLVLVSCVILDSDSLLQSALALGAFGTTLTTLSLGLMEWRGVTTANVFIANFFFIAAFGLVVTAQWELSIGNGFAYTVFSAFGE